MTNGELQEMLSRKNVAIVHFFESFPGQPIFTMGANGLVEINRP